MTTYPLCNRARARVRIFCTSPSSQLQQTLAQSSKFCTSHLVPAPDPMVPSHHCFDRYHLSFCVYQNNSGVILRKWRSASQMFQSFFKNQRTGFFRTYTAPPFPHTAIQSTTTPSPQNQGIYYGNINPFVSAPPWPP